MTLLDTLKAAFTRQANKRLANTEITRRAFNAAIEYLDDSDVFLPDFRLRIHQRFFGSYFDASLSKPLLVLGCYPTRFVTDWMVMHEIGHVLWHCYRPCRDRVFQSFFGRPRPRQKKYDEIHADLSWQGPLAHRVGKRPRGEPSPYGAAAGGEERFCELLGLMYSSKDGFHRPPSDLRKMWRACWDHGLALMTPERLTPM